MNMTGEIALFSAEGEQLATFSPGGAYLLGWANPAWSPNGKWLAFVTAPDRNGNGLADPGEPGEIWILDRERFKLAFSALQSGVLEWTPAWSSDSRWLAFGYRSEQH